MKSSITILGAGIQGVCSALALARQGHEIVLIDQSAGCLQRSSLRNTGKIHLGHVYAADGSMRTTQLMLESALKFGPLIEEWIGRTIDWDRYRTRPFTYLALKDSLVRTDKLLTHYNGLQHLFDAFNGAEHRYLGQSLKTLYEPTAIPEYCNRAHIDAAIATPEVGLKLSSFCPLLAAAVDANDRISCRFGQRIDTVRRQANGFAVAGRMVDGQPWSQQSDVVVNALWTGRLAIDTQLGYVPTRNWVYRLKYRVFARMPAALRDMVGLSMVLGPYGDVVPLGDEIYLQWYPACRRGWSTELSPPEAWDAACHDLADEATMAEVGSAARRGLAELLPAAEQAEILRCDAGVIFSWGKSDIDRPDSELHERHRIGVHGDDGYYSIDTGKFTCAPRFADDLTQRLGTQAAFTPHFTAIRATPKVPT